MPVMIEFAPTAFNPGGPLARYATVKEKMRWVLQTGSRSSTHIDVNTWFRGNYPQPPNSISIVVKGSHPSWIDTVDEFNRLELFEIRAQIANGIDRGILRVRGPGGTDVTADEVRGGTVPTGDFRAVGLDVLCNP
jgi:hypothetical protein